MMTNKRIEIFLEVFQFFYVLRLSGRNGFLYTLEQFGTCKKSRCNIKDKVL